MSQEVGSWPAPSTQHMVVKLLKGKYEEENLPEKMAETENSFLSIY